MTRFYGRILAPTLKLGSMKKLFTFCATALLAFTLSAQSEHAEGSFYLGTGDATDLFQLFSDDGISMDATIGYAVQDDLVVSGTVSNDGTDNLWTVGVTYYTGGFGLSVYAEDAMGDRTLSFGAGKYLPLGDEFISQRLYVYPEVRVDADQNLSSRIAFGLRF